MSVPSDNLDPGLGHEATISTMYEVDFTTLETGYQRMLICEGDLVLLGDTPCASVCPLKRNINPIYQSKTPTSITMSAGRGEKPSNLD